jgi:hypothetical protein
LSDHCGVSLCITFPTVLYADQPVADQPDVQRRSVWWSKASPTQVSTYRKMLSSKLASLNVDVPSCGLRNCSLPAHRQAIDNIAMQLQGVLIECSILCIPCKRAATSKPGVSGWNAECKELRQQSLMWHSIWVQAGRPNNGIVADIMRASRRKYHTNVKQVLRSQNEQRNVSLATASCNNRQLDFWDQVKRANAYNSKPSVCSVINGCNTGVDIANTFKDMYADTFRAGFTSQDDLELFHVSLTEQCEAEVWQAFTVDNVAAACLRLKANKKDADLDLSSDAIINAPHEFHVVLCSLINACISHGHVSPQWRMGTIIPLLKSSTLDKSSAASYRPITLSSLFGKIVDMLILEKYYSCFLSSDMQFGFKKSHSTAHCSHIVKEVINYYVENGSEVFACAIDMQKAFDRVDLTKLFSKLLLTGLSVFIVRILFVLYSNLCLNVFWNGAQSAMFHTLNGVKQGGILSPYLFNVFINDLLLSLQHLHVGCYVGHVFVGCVAYADDVILLAPSLRALRVMLDACSVFALYNNVLYNPAKSHCIRFSSVRPAVVQFPVCLQGQQLTWVDCITHLGHILSSNCDDSNDIRKRMSDYVRQVNYFLAKFGHLSVIIKSKLFLNYCNSFYGCELWSLSHRLLTEFDTTWRKSVRRVWRLPYTTHNVLIPVFANGVNFRYILHQRFINFASSCIHSSNLIISFISKIACASQRHCFGRNMSTVCQTLYPRACTPESLVACELVFVRDGLFTSNLSSVEVADLISLICCK